MGYMPKSATPYMPKSAQPVDTASTPDMSNNPLKKASDVLRFLGLDIVPEAAGAIANVPNLKNIANPEQYREGMRSNPFVDQEAIDGLAKGDTKKFRENARESNPTVAMNNVMNMIGGPSVLKGTAKVVAHPKQAVGRALEKKATDAGNVPNKLLEEVFGTVKDPNMKLIERIGSGRDQGKLLNMLRGEISTQGRSPGGMIPDPSFLSMLNKRIGIGKKAYEGTSSTVEKSFDKALQAAYSEVLKKGAGTGKLDKAYSTLNNIEKAGKNALPYGLSGAIGWLLINQIASKLRGQ